MYQTMLWASQVAQISWRGKVRSTGHRSKSKLHDVAHDLQAFDQTFAGALPTTYWARELEVDREGWNSYLKYARPCFCFEACESHSCPSSLPSRPPTSPTVRGGLRGLPNAVVLAVEPHSFAVQCK